MIILHQINVLIILLIYPIYTKTEQTWQDKRIDQLEQKLLKILQEPSFELDIDQLDNQNHHSNKDIPADVDISEGQVIGRHDKGMVVAGPDKPLNQGSHGEGLTEDRRRDRGGEGMFVDRDDADMDRVISEYLSEHGRENNNNPDKDKTSPDVEAETVIEKSDISEDRSVGLGDTLRSEVDAAGLSFTPEEAEKLINVLKSYISDESLDDVGEQPAEIEDNLLRQRGLTTKRRSSSTRSTRVSRSTARTVIRTSVTHRIRSRRITPTHAVTRRTVYSRTTTPRYYYPSTQDWQHSRTTSRPWNSGSSWNTWNSWNTGNNWNSWNTGDNWNSWNSWNSGPGSNWNSWNTGNTWTSWNSWNTGTRTRVRIRTSRRNGDWDHHRYVYGNRGNVPVTRAGSLGVVITIVTITSSFIFPIIWSCFCLFDGRYMYF